MHSKNDIDKFIKAIKNMMCLASNSLPRQKPKGYARLYWCPELTVLCRMLLKSRPGVSG